MLFNLAGVGRMKFKTTIKTYWANVPHMYEGLRIQWKRRGSNLRGFPSLIVMGEKPRYLFNMFNMFS